MDICPHVCNHCHMPSIPQMVQNGSNQRNSQWIVDLFNYTYDYLNMKKVCIKYKWHIIKWQLKCMKSLFNIIQITQVKYNSIQILTRMKNFYLNFIRIWYVLELLNLIKKHIRIAFSCFTNQEQYTIKHA